MSSFCCKLTSIEGISEVQWRRCGQSSGKVSDALKAQCKRHDEGSFMWILKDQGMAVCPWGKGGGKMKEMATPDIRLG